MWALQRRGGRSSESLRPISRLQRGSTDEQSTGRHFTNFGSKYHPQTFVALGESLVIYRFSRIDPNMYILSYVAT